jgi:hypothetical protein
MKKRSNKYDPSEFLFPSHDVDGRSVRTCVRIPPTLNQAIDSVMASNKFPFATRDDLTLWCLYKGIANLQAMEACVDVMPFLNIMVNLFRVNADLNRFDEFFASLDRVVLELTKSHFRILSARRLVKAVEEVVLCVRSGQDRRRFLQELRGRWGHLLTSSAEEATRTGTEKGRG